MRHVGHEHRCGRFPRVPENPDRAEGLTERVVLAEDGTDHDEQAEGEECDEGSLFREGEGRAKEERERNREDEEVGGEIKDEVGNEMVRCCRALDCRVGKVISV